MTEHRTLAEIIADERFNFTACDVCGRAICSTCVECHGCEL